MSKDKHERKQQLRFPRLPDGWPTLDEHALQGIAGDFVKLVEPQTESDPAALLVQFLTAFGTYIGAGPTFRVGATPHHTNLFTLIVGETSRARKGTAFDHVREVFSSASSEWPEKCFLSGLSTGEGLINSVRDHTPGQSQVIDKRRLVYEPEFARVLRVQRREANTLSPVLRVAWDGNKPLQVATRNDPLKASAAHISIIGHITEDELRRELFATDQANGYANRFLFVCARRSKKLPDGGHVDPAKLQRIAEQVRKARRASASELKRSDKAQGIWEPWYTALPDLPGMFGAITSRAEAQVLRLSMIYALLDQSRRIHSEHLKAAWAVWEYSFASVRHIFGTITGDPTADRIFRALQQAGSDGLSRTNIRELFSRNLSEQEISAALLLLYKNRLACSKQEKTEGRPRELWTAL